MPSADITKGRPVLSRSLVCVGLVASVATAAGIGALGSDRWIAKGYGGDQTTDIWSRTEPARTAAVSTEAGDEAYWLTAPRVAFVEPASAVDGTVSPIVVGHRITPDAVGSKTKSSTFEIVAVTPISTDVRAAQGEGTVVFVAARRVGADGKLTGRTVRFLARTHMATDGQKSL